MRRDQARHTARRLRNNEPRVPGRENRRAEFEQGVFRAAAEFDNNFTFDFNGPWPPSAFAEIRITS